MFSIIGIVVVFGCIAAGYLMEHGNLKVLLQPAELLIVGGADLEVLELNRGAGTRLRCPWELAVVPGATHLFEEPGAMQEVDRLAAQWFETHLVAPGPR